jgi:hypothetical protein
VLLAVFGKRDDGGRWKNGAALRTLFVIAMPA